MVMLDDSGASPIDWVEYYAHFGGFPGSEWAIKEAIKHGATKAECVAANHMRTVRGALPVAMALHPRDMCTDDTWNLE